MKFFSTLWFFNHIFEFSAIFSITFSLITFISMADTSTLWHPFSMGLPKSAGSRHSFCGPFAQMCFHTHFCDRYWTSMPMHSWHILSDKLPRCSHIHLSQPFSRGIYSQNAISAIVFPDVTHIMYGYAPSKTRQTQRLTTSCFISKLIFRPKSLWFYLFRRDMILLAANTSVNQSLITRIMKKMQLSAGKKLRGN